ncbi:MAG: alpha/beta hydrolase [Lentisphaeria bacterium]|jgi:hypothetical protein
MKLPPLLDALRTLLTAAALGYGLLLLAGCAFQKRLVFFPERELPFTPASAGLAFEDRWLATPDGIRLHAWWIPAAPGPEKGVILHTHGNAGNIAHRLDKAAAWSRAGYATLLLEYRGYGRSGGAITEAGLYRDAATAWRHLTMEKGIPPRRIIIFGTSLGGAVAAHLAQGKGPAGLVLESSFLSLPDVAAHHYPWLPVRLLLRYRFPTGEFLAKVACPVLVLHGPADEIVPYANGRRLYERAHGPKQFLPLRGGHNDGRLEEDPDLRQNLLRVLDAWTAESATEKNCGQGLNSGVDAAY